LDNEESKRRERIPRTEKKGKDSESREEKGNREQSSSEELVIGRVRRDSAVIVTVY
jgi:hypothetical protein